MGEQVDLEPDRTARYKKNAQTEQIKAVLNRILAPLERELIARFKKPRYPIIFIVGAPRSGTTLLNQLLIAYFKVGYINNLVARFWMAPYIGVQLISELQDLERHSISSFTSDLGATSGYEDPHEFGYFWRRWFKYNDTHQLGKGQIKKIDTESFRKEIAAVESIFDCPMVFKNLVCSLQIDFLAEALPTAVFIHCRRDPIYAAQSILLSRLNYYNNKETWFSLKPKEYKWLKDRPYADQIAGQIFYTRQQIEQVSASLSSSRYLTIDYEVLCKKPKEQLERVASLVAKTGYELFRRDITLPILTSTNKQRLNNKDFFCLKRSINQIFKQNKKNKKE